MLKYTSWPFLQSSLIHAGRTFSHSNILYAEISVNFSSGTTTLEHTSDQLVMASFNFSNNRSDLAGVLNPTCASRFSPLIARSSLKSVYYSHKPVFPIQYNKHFELCVRFSQHPDIWKNSIAFEKTIFG